MTTAHVLQVRTPAMPRGARFAGLLFARAMNWLFSPTQARMLSRAEEANDVRALAYSVMRTDPGFAADLFAAADRHEALGE